MSFDAGNFGKFLEDFKVGEVYKHAACHSITVQDNADFCRLTCNPHPLHQDPVYASQSRFGQIIVAGTYVFSLVVGLSVPDISAKAIANLCYEKVIHHAPVHIDDTIHAQSRILDVKPSQNNKPQGVITVETKAYNQHDELVLSFTRSILIPMTKADKEAGL